MDRYPKRIICLTEETTETLYLLGAQDRIVGISGYVVRPPQARREKPRVSAFTSANIDKIVALKPDVVLTFSDLQADIAADLIRRGLDVHAFNQRSVAGILEMIRTVGVMGDYRTYDYVCGLRAVTSLDGMTADIYPFDAAFLSRVATRERAKAARMGRGSPTARRSLGGKCR